MAVFGAAGVLVAIVANLTSIVGFIEDHVLRRGSTTGASSGRSAIVPVAHAAAVLPPTASDPALPPASPLPTRPPTVARPPSVPRSAAGVSIRTPDQRVRVFVSSTLHELAHERAAARGAIEALRLTPVMFEIGARAHAPRDLYRAYLEQSDVFVAIYGVRYGWVAPDETISGLEDEWLRSGERPKLVYVKRVDEREDRLQELLERIQADDEVSYRPFRDAHELGELLADDLATLLTERFDRSSEGWMNSALAPVPVAWGPLIGRERELERACAFLREPSIRILTVVGPGGIGKSRLALEIADRARGWMPDGVAFVSLQGVRDPALVGEAVATALGVQVGQGRGIIDAVRAFLADRSMLLVVDNLEQLVEAAPLFARLIEGAPGVKLLLTSRTPLRLSAERVLPVTPLRALELPAASEPPTTLERAQADPSVQLFLWRASAILPDLELSDHNASVLLDIARRLEGWPLALVLAAAKVGHLSLPQLLSRLSRRLDLLAGGARDMPQRQRTLRATIAWSLDLLSCDARTLLARVSVCAGGCTLEGIERLVAGLPWPSGGTPDIVDLLGELVDQSLLVRSDDASGSRYGMLELVREAALELLDASSERRAVEDAHARTYLALAEEASPLIFDGRPSWFLTLSAEALNIRAAVAHAVASGQTAVAAGFASALWLFWWTQLQGEEHLAWIEPLLARTDLDPLDRARLATAGAALHLHARAMGRSIELIDEAEPVLEVHGEGRSLAAVSIGRALLASYAGDLEAMERHALGTRERARMAGFAWAESFAAVLLGRVHLARGNLDAALPWAEEGVALTRSAGDKQSEAWARQLLGVIHALAGRFEAARDELLHVAGLFAELGLRAGEAMSLRALAFAAAVRGDAEAAAVLAGAAEAASQRYGVLALEPEHGIELAALEAARAATDAACWVAAHEQGLAMPIAVARAFAASAREGPAATAA